MEKLILREEKLIVKKKKKLVYLISNRKHTTVKGLLISENDFQNIPSEQF